MKSTFKQIENNLATSSKDYTAFGGVKKNLRRWFLNPAAEVSLEVKYSLMNTDRTQQDIETIKDIDIRVLEDRLSAAIKSSNKIIKQLKKVKSRKERKALREDLETGSFTIKYYRKELTKARRK